MNRNGTEFTRDRMKLVPPTPRDAPKGTFRESLAQLKSTIATGREKIARREVEEALDRRFGKVERSIEEKIRAVGCWVQSEIRAQSEGANSSGAAVVPSDEVAEAIIAIRDSRGAFRAAASKMPMRSDSKFAPRRLTGLTANFVGENPASIAESSMSWDAVRLVAKKIAILTKISAELEEDSAFDVGLIFLQEVGYAFASKEDNCGFYGDGTSAYGGIKGVFPLLTDGAHDASKFVATGNATFNLLTTTDLSNLMSIVPAVAVPGARWFVSQRGYALAFCRLAGAAGGISTQYDADGVLRPFFMGFPVMLTQVMPQATTSLTGQVMVGFGDLSLAATLGDRRDLRLRFSTHRFMDSDQVGVLGTQRFDANVHDLGDNTTAGPMAALVGG
jgi:HK97 family phage major capsid protein